MGNLGKYAIAFREHSPYMQYGTKTSFAKNERINKITYAEFIKRLTPHFSFPDTEIKRLVNCIFHELLTCIREGNNVSISHFGVFTGQFMAGKVTFNIGLNQYNATPKIHQRCQPILLPSSYAVHVCSPKNAFSDPAWFLSKKTKLTPTSKILWFRNNVRFHKRALMIYDNPYAMAGFKDISYKLKESTGVTFPSETDISEMQELESLLKDKAYAADKRVVKRFVLQDLKKKKCLWSYYNYLPGKYFVGADNNFFMTEDEVSKKKTRYQVIGDRIKKNKKLFTDTSHLPKERPDDLSWNYEEMEGGQ